MLDPKHFIDVVGAHPAQSDEFGVQFDHLDGHSIHGVPTRSLTETGSDTDQFVGAMRKWILLYNFGATYCKGCKVP